MAATTTAFATVELLEAILANLDFFDIMAARAVSSNWSSVVERSPQLQKTLFRVATTCLAVEITESTKHLRFPVTSTLASSPLSTLPLFRTFDHHYCSASDRKHPARLLRKSPTFYWDGSGKIPSTMYSFEWRPDDLHALPQSQLMRGMLITQPACEAMRLSVHGPRDERSAEWDRSVISCAVLRVSNGIRVGDVVDTVEAMLASTGGREWLVRIAVLMKKSAV
ncbi:hypothetical protein LTR97_005082 [Elasticomyces elasticus]|uniref:F-box domain-containing protein n=1 Tax=Elasticomyces elasticus TaxID=574655 RepID=A0AAN7W6K0_9PEZI|nr:hypothetical protein LTR97_005082 [Elasticomyces elasticus]